MKQSFYFSHDYNARNDRLMIKLLMKKGVAGIGIYWCIVEMLYEEGGYLSRAEYERISFELRDDVDSIKFIIECSELFQYDDEKFWSESVLRRLNLRIEKSEKARKSVQSRWKKYERTSNDNECNTIKERKGNKEKKSKEEDVTGKTSRFSAPSINDIQSFLINDKKVNTEDAAYYAQRFINFYESKSWMVGKNKMTNWKTAAIRSLEWEDKRQKNQSSGSHFQSTSKPKINVIDYQP